MSQVAAFTPAAAECVVDTTNNRICVGDRRTAGGEASARALDGLDRNACSRSGRRSPASRSDLAADDVEHADRVRRHAERRPREHIDRTGRYLRRRLLCVDHAGKFFASGGKFNRAANRLVQPVWRNGKTAHVPVRLDGNLPPQLGRPRRRVGGNAFASPFTVSTNAAALPAGVGATTSLAQFGCVDGGVPAC